MNWACFLKDSNWRVCHARMFFQTAAIGHNYQIWSRKVRGREHFSLMQRVHMEFQLHVPSGHWLRARGGGLSFFNRHLAEIRWRTHSLNGCCSVKRYGKCQISYSILGTKPLLDTMKTTAWSISSINRSHSTVLDSRSVCGRRCPTATNACMLTASPLSTFSLKHCTIPLSIVATADTKRRRENQTPPLLTINTYFNPFSYSIFPTEPKQCISPATPETPPPLSYSAASCSAAVPLHRFHSCHTPPHLFPFAHTLIPFNLIPLFRDTPTTTV